MIPNEMMLKRIQSSCREVKVFLYEIQAERKLTTVKQRFNIELVRLVKTRLPLKNLPVKREEKSGRDSV